MSDDNPYGPAWAELKYTRWERDQLAERVTELLAENEHLQTTAEAATGLLAPLRDQNKRLQTDRDSLYWALSRSLGNDDLPDQVIAVKAENERLRAVVGQLRNLMPPAWQKIIDDQLDGVRNDGREHLMEGLSELNVRNHELLAENERLRLVLDSARDLLDFEATPSAVKDTGIGIYFARLAGAVDTYDAARPDRDHVMTCRKCDRREQLLDQIEDLLELALVEGVQTTTENERLRKRIEAVKQVDTEVLVRYWEEIHRLRAVVDTANKMMGRMQGPGDRADPELWLALELALADWVNAAMADEPMTPETIAWVRAQRRTEPIDDKGGDL